MAQDALLAQIKKLFEEEREQTRRLVREEVDAVEKRLSTKIDKVQQSVDIVQNVMVEHYKKLEDRVTQLEADSEFPKSH